MPEELKPCPFCGADAEQPECLKAGGSRPRWKISCSQYCITMYRDSKRRVVADWNRRAPDPEVERAVEGMADLLRQILAYSTPEPTPVHSLGLLDIAGVHKMARRRLAAYEAAREAKP